MTINGFMIVLTVNTLIAYFLYVLVRYDREQRLKDRIKKNKSDK